MTLREAAVALGLEQSTLRQQIAHGSLRAQKVGRDWHVTAREVERYRAVSLGRSLAGHIRVPRVPCPRCGGRKDRAARVCWSCFTAEGKNRPLDERFWPLVDVKTDECWGWLGPHMPNGYGKLGIGGGGHDLAHRVAWQVVYGPIPDGLFVLHHCDNRGCVRPTHLFLGTHTDNMADMVAKGRSMRGDRHYRRRVLA